MEQYIVTIWDRDWHYTKYSYKVGLTDPKQYVKILKTQYDRFTIEPTGEIL